MSETGKKVLDALSNALPKMSEAEKERLLWFSEGLAAAARAQGAAKDSA